MKRPLRRRPAKTAALAVTLGLMLALDSGSCGAVDVNVVVDPTERHQVMTGWEITAAAPESYQWGTYDYYKDIMNDRTINDVGINRVRIGIRSGSEQKLHNYAIYRAKGMTEDAWRAARYVTVNDNDDPNVINWDGFDFTELDDHIDHAYLPLKERLNKKGQRLYLDLEYVAFTIQIKSGAYIHDDPEEYAEFVLATYLHLRDRYGIVPDAWEVILEPDNSVQWNTGFVVGKAMVATARRLTAAGFTPRFIAPSVTDMGNAARYFDEMAAVPGALDHLEEFSYHRYRRATPENLDAIVRRAKKYNIKTSMLEYWFGQGTYEVLHEDLTRGQNSSWQGEMIQDLYLMDLSDIHHPRLTLKPEERMNRQYFRYIRAGAQRIGAGTSSPVIDPIAFEDPNRGYTVVMKAKRASKVSLTGLPSGEYGVSYATTEDCLRSPPRRIGTGAVLETEIPDKGVLTVYDMRVVNRSEETAKCPD